MFFYKIVRMFKDGNVCVCGLRGTGKDVLTGNVIARRNVPYVSNLDYTGGKNYQKLDFDKIDVGKNTWRNLIKGKPRYYKFPYAAGSDIYISDVGIYMPSQYCSELNREFPHLPTYMALSRQVSHNNFHINVQSLNRAWDKIREQSDQYIRCRWCKVLFGFLVIQRITIYDKYQSAVDRVHPCRIRVPIFASAEVRQQASLYLDKFFNTYGDVKNHWLIYFNYSKHDTYYFEKLFEEGEKNEK
ncbi:MAG: hypothetical protein IJX97_00535 [Clostridia bacterium]|nr:hypothetical protein [Clostridia bacterium]